MAQALRYLNICRMLPECRYTIEDLHEIHVHGGEPLRRILFVLGVVEAERRIKEAKPVEV